RIDRTFPAGLVVDGLDACETIRPPDVAARVVGKLEPLQPKLGVRTRVDGARRRLESGEPAVGTAGEQMDDGHATLVRIPRVDAERIGIDLLPDRRAGGDAHARHAGVHGGHRLRALRAWRRTLGEPSEVRLHGEQSETTTLLVQAELPL